MSSDSLSGWFLWLNPTSETSPQFDQIVQNLSSHNPKSVLYAPHATLYADIPLSTPLSDIRTHVKSIISKSNQKGSVRCTSLPLTTGESHFHCVIAPVEITDELEVLRKGCVDVWGDRGTFYPHMSLKYAIADARRRGELVGLAEKEERPMEWMADGIAIVKCDGTADTWEVVETVLFAPKDGSL